MKVIFNKTNVIVDNNIEFTYEELQLEKGYEKIFNLLKKCVSTDEKVEFNCSNDCSPFGKRLKEIIAVEFDS